MFSYECDVCHGLCDPGELENGVCFDCRSDMQDERNSGISRSPDKLNKQIRARFVRPSDGQTMMVG